MLDRAYIQEKLGNAAMLMSNRTPALLGFYLMLEKRIVNDKTVTMRVGYADGQPYLEAGDWFINMLEPSLLGAVVYMNCLRIALHHCDIRVKAPEEIFKLASDIVVCEYARTLVNTDVGDNAKILSQLFPSIWSYSALFDKAGFDPATDLTLEKVFAMLSHSQESGDGDDDDGDNEPEWDDENSSGNSEDDGDNEDNGDEEDSSDGSNGSEDGESEGSEPGDESNGQEDSSEDGESEDNESGDDSNGKEDGSDESGQKDGSDESGEDSDGEGDGDGSSKSYRAIQQMFDSQNASSDMQDWGENEEFADDIRSRAASAYANGNLGEASGRVPIIIKEANKVKVDAATIFTMFMESNFSSSHRQTWSMPNLVLRRFGPIAPGHVRKKGKPAILFGIDVSGSMLSMNMAEKCIIAVDRFLGDTKMDLCYWDAKCSEILHNPKDAYTGDLFGGGGTNPQCVIDEVERQHLHYDGIVMLTDCDFEWPMPPNPGQICIIRTPNSGAQFPIWCQWKMEFEDVLR